MDKNKLSFQVLGDDTAKTEFEVVNFEGREAISESYEFKILIRSKNPVIKNHDLLGKRVVFRIKIYDDFNKKDQIAKYHGILLEFSSLKKFSSSDKNNNYPYYYKVTMAPKLSNLKYSKKSDVFVQSSLPEILQSVFSEHKFTDNDKQVVLKQDAAKYRCIENIYNRYAHVCQYEESDYNFLNRLLERDGVYYYFQQNTDQEKLIITDDVHSFLSREHELVFHSTQSRSVGIDPNTVNMIECESKVLPAKVIIKNFCYEKADKGEKLDGVISVEQAVNPDGSTDSALIGEEVIYGENFINADKGMGGDGEFLAKIRAQEIYCRKQVYTVTSSALPISAGMKIIINDHDDKEFSGEYLVTEVVHGGEQFEANGDISSERDFYQNTFKLIPANVQFRSERKTPWPRIYGTMNAFIDGEDNGKSKKTPYLNEFGCYKVSLPFIKNSKPDGKNSIWLRLATPYAGDGHGLHFPLYKGTEVVLSFRDGNPDLPVIMAAVFNSANKNILNAETARNGGGILTKENSIFFNDAGKKIESCSDGSWHTL